MCAAPPSFTANPSGVKLVTIGATAENIGSYTITGGTRGTTGITVSVSSSAGTVIPQANINVNQASSSLTRNILVTPAGGATAGQQSNIQLTLRDACGVQSSAASFTVRVARACQLVSSGR